VSVSRLRKGTPAEVKSAKPIIGLAGGIGSGKSAVASILGDLGAAVISSDRLSHEELNAPEVLAQLRDWWGEGVVGIDGQADRGAIRKAVLDDPAARQRLEALLHPRIARRRDALMRNYQADPDVRAIVWDSPLLYEAGLDEQCDCVVFVEADAEARLERVARERGWAPDDLHRFEKSQKPLDFKSQSADYRIVNNSDMDSLRRAAKEVLSRILSGI
jgi:dephospho-CoA kinase